MQTYPFTCRERWANEDNKVEDKKVVDEFESLDQIGTKFSNILMGAFGWILWNFGYIGERESLNFLIIKRFQMQQNSAIYLSW